MKVLVDISDDVYTRLFDNGIQDNEITVDDVCEMARALRNGVPLPKRHGDLKDAKEVYKKFYCRCLAGVATEVLNETPIIIEADKAERSKE